MSAENQNSKANMTILQGLAILDGLLTAAAHLERWINSRRQVGEMTPEEEAAHDAFLERKFQEWQSDTSATSATPPTTAIEARD